MYVVGRDTPSASVFRRRRRRRRRRRTRNQTTTKAANRRRRRRRVRLKRTNLRVRGLSLNRSQKWTALLSTTPRLRPRSSANDLAPPHRVCLLSRSARGRVPVGVRQEPSCCGLATAGAEIGRNPAHIVACRRRGADGIVAIFWTGF